LIFISIPKVVILKLFLLFRAFARLIFANDNGYHLENQQIDLWGHLLSLYEIKHILLFKITTD